jgi:hypothetical protein
MQTHRIPFFGQTAAMIVESPGWDNPVLFLRMLRKKEDGKWEKCKPGEGRVLKLNLLEMICIRDLLAKDHGTWTTFHTNKEEKFKIALEKTEDTLKINIAEYAKLIKYPETVLLHELLCHLVQEKIEWATNSTPKKSENSTSQPSSSRTASIKPSTPSTPPTLPSHAASLPQKVTPPPPNPAQHEEDISLVVNADIDYPFEEEEEIIRKEEIKSQTTLASNPISENNPGKDERVEWYMHLLAEGKFVFIPGNIIETSPKAVRFQITQKNQIWIPKSVIKPPLPDTGADRVLVEKWWLEKNLEKVTV